MWRGASNNQNTLQLRYMQGCIQRHIGVCAVHIVVCLGVGNGVCGGVYLGAERPD